MFIDVVPNGRSAPAVLLRESFREGRKVHKRTIANLSQMPPELIDGLRALLAGGAVVGGADQALEIRRSLPHGHVAAALGMMRKLELPRLLGRRASRERNLALALIAGRVIAPGSKLSTLRGLNPQTATTSLGEILELGAIEEREIYAALDWLGAQQGRIERQFARRHLRDGTLVLYDVSSSYLEGRHCELAHHGYSRDHRPDRPQIVYGLLCDREGRPIAVEVFEGNTADPATIAAQVEKLKRRFHLERVVLVGDRGMITTARIRETIKPAGLDWISCLRAGQIQDLAEGPLQMSLFDERDIAAITSPDYPGERLIACRNAALATERRRKREALLVATETELARIRDATRRKRAPLHGEATIGLAVGAVINQRKMAKHFDLTITASRFDFQRNAASIAREAALDGIYVIRTSVSADVMSETEAVSAYKDLSRVERAFRTLKSVDLAIRPVHHWLSPRVRAHVFLCMMAYYVEWHLRDALKPLLFQDHDRPGAEAERASPVAPASTSPAADRKRRRRRNDQNLPISSFTDLMAHLATQTLNTAALPKAPNATFTTLANPTPLQAAAFDLIGIDPMRVQ
ncbi:IS1634 family transposase (plasmid) [Acidiphilium multivorum]|uniref:IS1634 family transposase n=1 Tax=Acidiphilium multivorum TaxID=62140 RepID=UPI001F4BCDF0|nr:IS1634 family transposase [Acidiphilium multivorum]UNC13043.1 IS1634 family transposase [Acidiphilium multivorum]UNC16599.1 IS1634 family transposase [Acidiphilium multivorum]